MRKAIFLYDRSGAAAKPWADAGYMCYCFDGQHPDGVTKTAHINIRNVGMWFDAYRTREAVAAIRETVGDGVEFVFGFPECTDMTVAGARHFKAKGEKNPAFQAEAVELARLVKYVGDDHGCAWGAENPVSVLATIWQPSSFTFDPADFGGLLPVTDVHPEFPEVYPGRDAYNKKTCIWSGGGYAEPERNKIPPLHKENPGWKHCGGKSTRTKNIRSSSPRGFCMAQFLSNGSYITDPQMALFA